MGKFKTALIVIIISITTQAYAFEKIEYKEWSLEIGYEQYQFDLKEKTDGLETSKDNGTLEGVFGEIKYKWPETVYFTINGNVLSGSTNNEYVSSDGTTTTSWINNSIWNAGVDLGYTFWPVSYFTFTPYTGCRYTDWERAVNVPISIFLIKYY